MTNLCNSAINYLAPFEQVVLAELADRHIAEVRHNSQPVVGCR